MSPRNHPGDGGRMVPDHRCPDCCWPNGEHSAECLAGALARAAQGRYPVEAAVRLLVHHGHWPRTLLEAGYVDVTGEDDGPLLAHIQWDAALAALARGDLPAFGSDTGVLRIAASLGGGGPVDLGGAVGGLNRTNLTLVLAAISQPRWPAAASSTPPAGCCRPSPGSVGCCCSPPAST